jgi:hypothetical protein
MQQQIEQLGGEVEGTSVLENAIRGAIDDKRAEAIRGSQAYILLPSAAGC